MSPETDLPDFMRSQLGSVWALEMLLLLRRAPRRAWTVAETVAELRAATGLVQGIFDRFLIAGVIVADGDLRYRYAPASLMIDGLCDAVEEAYRQRPVATIALISAPADRLQQLANAFRVRGPKR
ncbi:MAG TPA: hypothetical protein VGG92_13775 [Caulobacteraceae bacterium]|jgi:hypothetical protein